MSAKDYKLVVSGLGGVAYLAKVSKTDPHLMLSDRVKLDDSVCLQFIEEFAKHKITEERSIMECKTEDGRLIYEIRFPNKASDKRRSEMNELANSILSATDGMKDEYILRMPGIPLTLISLAKMVQKLTS